MRSKQARTILFFLVKCVVLYALFVVPWPGVANAYRSLFRQAGDGLFYRVGDAALVKFTKMDGANGKDTRVELENRRDRQAGALEIRAMYWGYRPTVFLMALILATPLPWSRRGKALIWGLLLVNVFIGVRLWLRITDAYCDPKMLGLYTISDFWRSMLHGVMLVVSLAPAMTYIAPLTIWMLVMFRRGDWAVLLQEPGDGAKHTPAAARS